MAKVFFKHPEDGAMTEGQLVSVKVWQDENLFKVTHQDCSYEVAEVFKDKECGKIDCVYVYSSLGRNDRAAFPLSPKYGEKLVVFPDRHYEKLSVAVFEYSVGAGVLFFLTPATYRSEDGNVYEARDVFDTYEDMSSDRRVWHREENGEQVWTDGYIEDLNTLDADQLALIDRFKELTAEMTEAGITPICDRWSGKMWWVNEKGLRDKGLAMEVSYDAIENAVCCIRDETRQLIHELDWRRETIEVGGDETLYIRKINKDK